MFLYLSVVSTILHLILSITNTQIHFTREPNTGGMFPSKSSEGRNSSILFLVSEGFVGWNTSLPMMRTIWKYSWIFWVLKERCVFWLIMLKQKKKIYAHFWEKKCLSRCRPSQITWWITVGSRLMNDSLLNKSQLTKSHCLAGRSH